MRHKCFRKKWRNRAWANDGRHFEGTWWWALRSSCSILSDDFIRHFRNFPTTSLTNVSNFLCFLNITTIRSTTLNVKFYLRLRFKHASINRSSLRNFLCTRTWSFSSVFLSETFCSQKYSQAMDTGQVITWSFSSSQRVFIVCRPNRAVEIKKSKVFGSPSSEKWTQMENTAKSSQNNPTATATCLTWIWRMVVILMTSREMVQESSWSMERQSARSFKSWRLFSSTGCRYHQQQRHFPSIPPWTSISPSRFRRFRGDKVMWQPRQLNLSFRKLAYLSQVLTRKLTFIAKSTGRCLYHQKLFPLRTLANGFSLT